MKIGVLADLHLPDDSEILQWKVLDAALEICISNNVDVIVLAGDMIQAGAAEAALRLGKKLAKCAVPIVATLGNTELATPDFTAALSFTDNFTRDNVSIRTVESGKNFEFDGRLHIIAGHWPPAEVPADVDLYIAGHLHRDIDDGKLQALRGLDPDKVIGGPPCVTFFDIDGDGCIQRREEVIPGFSLKEWSAEERRGLLSHIGVSLKSDLRTELRRAADLGIRLVEINYALLGDAEIVRQYIKEMEGTVSVHLPEISFEDPDEVLEYMQRALDAGATRFTLHVPCAPASVMENPQRFSEMVSYYCRVVEMAPHALFGIENMHMCQGETVENRRFGYLPGEQLAFINAVRQRLPEANISGVTDIGHCRNNAPFSSNISISQWYHAMRGNVVTMHLHQVRQVEGGGFRNHTALTGWYEPLISLASFIHEWKDTRFGGAVFFLECRTGGWEDSYEMFRRTLSR